VRGSGYKTGVKTSTFRTILRKQTAFQVPFPLNSRSRFQAVILVNHQIQSKLNPYRKRILTTGVCSATYDSVFFGTEHYLRSAGELTPVLSYGFSAVAAVVCAFAFDTVVARMMVIPPSKPVPGFFETLKSIFPHKDGQPIYKRVSLGYRGLSARGMEFFVNYSIVGFTGVYVVMAFKGVVGE